MGTLGLTESCHIRGLTLTQTNKLPGPWRFSLGAPRIDTLPRTPLPQAQSLHAACMCFSFIFVQFRSHIYRCFLGTFPHSCNVK